MTRSAHSIYDPENRRAMSAGSRTSSNKSGDRSMSAANRGKSAHSRDASLSGRESVASGPDEPMAMNMMQDYSEPEDRRMISRIPNAIPEDMMTKAWAQSVWASNGQVGGEREMTRFVPPRGPNNRSSVQV